MAKSARNATRRSQSRTQVPPPGRPVRAVSRVRLILLVVVVLGSLYVLFSKGPGGQPEALQVPDLSSKIKNKQLVVNRDHPLYVVKVEGRDGESLDGYYLNPTQPGEPIHFRTPVESGSNQALMGQLQEAGYVPTIKTEANQTASAVVSALPIVAFFVVFMLIFTLIKLFVRKLFRPPAA